ncbi:MAG: SGNH/GDSL hydrolase family protein [Victivallaceae bacterium]|nr:SGNH/GDSL hydrolase family protein [Victivallaceae bacterium]
MSDIAKADKNMATAAAENDGLLWRNAEDQSFELSGLAFHRRGEPFRRLPLHPVPAEPNEGVTYLAWHTSGVMLRFRSDTLRVAVKSEAYYGELMDHMAQTGNCGCDLYIDGRFIGVSRYPVLQKKYQVDLFNCPAAERKIRDFCINFPLYDGVKAFEVGIETTATVAPPSPWSRKERIVWYGTSIQQGGCASRPGTGLTNIVSRALNTEIINLAFSGSGRGEPEMAQLMCQVSDPAMFVLDYEANVQTAAAMRSTLPVLIDIIREKYPRLPIVVISRIAYSHDLIAGYPDNTSRESRLEGAQIQRSEVERRRAAGDGYISFIDGGELLGEDFWECTVDGIHPTDLGFRRMADRLVPRLAAVLN